MLIKMSAGVKSRITTDKREYKLFGQTVEINGEDFVGLTHG